MKKNVIYIQLILIAAFVTLSSCNSPQKSCKELFGEYYQESVDAFTAVAMKADTAMTKEEAHKIADFMLRGLYEKDSTFVKMSNSELDEFFYKNVGHLKEMYQRSEKILFDLVEEGIEIHKDAVKKGFMGEFIKGWNSVMEEERWSKAFIHSEKEEK